MRESLDGCGRLGDGAAWVGAIGTTLAFTATLYLLLRQWRDRRTEQARKVSAWVVEVVELRTWTQRGAHISPGDGQSVRVRVRNASELPIHGVTAWVRSDYSQEAQRVDSLERVVVPTGDVDVWADGVRLPEGGLADDPYVDLTFRDAAGKYWQRLFDGSLGPDRTSRHD